MTDSSSGTLLAENLCAALGKVIRGRQDTVELVITSLLADGHVLLEDYPGSGKRKTCGPMMKQII